jgi:hypothetical protein
VKSKRAAHAADSRDPLLKSLSCFRSPCSVSHLVPNLPPLSSCLPGSLEPASWTNFEERIDCVSTRGMHDGCKTMLVDDDTDYVFGPIEASAPHDSGGSTCLSDLDCSMITDSNLSCATTIPPDSYDSVSSVPPRMHLPGEVEAYALYGGEVKENPSEEHANAMERGGFNMAQLKSALVTESRIQEPLVDIVGVLLDKTVHRNDQRHRVSSLCAFESTQACPLSASEYLQRIMKYGKCSPSCPVVALIYLQRIKQKEFSVRITSNNMQRLLLAAMLVANKYIDDIYFSNRHWAKIGNINIKEINALEVSVLNLLGWNLHVTREQYMDYLHNLGCGPTVTWEKDLIDLRSLVTSGVGVCLYNEISGHQHNLLEEAVAEDIASASSAMTVPVY